MRLVMKPLWIQCLTFCGLNCLLSLWANTDYDHYSLEELMGCEVNSSSRSLQKVSEADSSLSVVTASMIRERGYQNLVQVLQDIPGFDFAMGEDGGGEYTIHSVHRGLGGDNGNSKILVMVDGVVQNFINNNWSTLWTNEMMLNSIKRIEIVQGPGAVIYGSNAVSGIIHFIMDDSYSGGDAILSLGQNQSRTVDVKVGKMSEQLNVQLSLHYHQSEGDNGDRYDPGGYFSGLQYPQYQTEDYVDGEHVQLGRDDDVLLAHPRSGESLRDGFSTFKEDFSAWLSLGLGGDLKLEAFYWQKYDGLASYVPGYEYVTNDPQQNYRSKMNGFHLGFMHETSLNTKLSLDSNLVFRSTEQAPETGFVYTYRFDGMEKSYHSRSSQAYLEEVFRYQLTDRDNIVFGGKLVYNAKMPQIVSLGARQDVSENVTTSSWDEAIQGRGLGISKYSRTFRSQEWALYGMYRRRFSSNFRAYVGLRYDQNDKEFGDVFSPLFSLTRDWSSSWSTRFMWGRAFRQPSNFEYYDEFRGNVDLVPERVQSFELEQRYHPNRHWLCKSALFYSLINDDIQVIDQRYQNSPRKEVGGVIFSTTWDPEVDVDFYGNVIWTQGQSSRGSWGDIEHVAAFKLNLGLNWLTFAEHLNTNIRMNLVGKTLAPKSNRYIWREHGGYAPSFFCVNLTLTLRRVLGDHFEPQLVVRNLLDRDHFTLGRQDGNSDISEWDPLGNNSSSIDPSGFTPAYHPQPGRRVLLNMRYTF